MKRKWIAGAVVLLLCAAVEPARTRLHSHAAVAADTVHVAPPTGERAADRASILAALEEVRPGGTIQFAPGTYLIGEIIPVPVSRITIAGHADGSTLRGCDPDEWASVQNSRASCNTLELLGSHQTVRDLTFEHMSLGLALGPGTRRLAGLATGDEEAIINSISGGHLIEGNTFRDSSNGIRGDGRWSEPIVIRGNRFINTYHAVSFAGSHVHLLDNDIAVPQPERVPITGHPGLAVGIAGANEHFPGGPFDCDHNVIAGNRIEGHPQGSLYFYALGGHCRHNVIRDNTIIVPATTRFSGDPLEEAGVPLLLYVAPMGHRSVPNAEDRGSIEQNVIEGNHIVGAEGLGIAIHGASRNRIVANTIVGITRQERNLLELEGLTGEQWREGNGSAIWVLPGSDENEIAGNIFEDIASHAVVLAGDRNRVETRSAADAVRDLGNGNRVNVREGDLDGAAAPDTIRYTRIIAGRPAGERLTWREAPDIWRYVSPEAHPVLGFPLTSRIVFDGAGLPMRIEVDGDLCGVCYREAEDTWQERFELRDGVAAWSTPLDRGEVSVSGPADYAALYPAHDVGVLARALLGRADGTLPLLPGGEARLEPLGERSVQLDDRRRTIRHYAVHGLDLQPRYLWLDEDGTTFADETTILAGWEAVFADLDAEMAAALAEHMRSMAVELVPPARHRPLVIHGARLFDPETGAVRDGTTILVEGTRVAAVGADGEVALPPGAETIDAAGRMVLPGLWEMHAHHTTDPYFELVASLHLAAGVTTARDLGSDVERLASLRRRIDAGEAVGPRILAAGFIDGPGGSPYGTVRTVEEARTIVDSYAERGYVQIKVYNDLPPNLLRAVTERARHHGLRVGGHLPFDMTGREAVLAGLNEIHHLAWFVAGVVDRPAASIDSAMVASMVAAVPGTAAWERFVALLRAHDVVVDPTLLLERDLGRNPDWITAVADRLPPQARRRLSAGLWIPQPPVLAERWTEIAANRFLLVKALHEAGVPLVAGSDLSGGFGLQRELELYAESGIAAHEVLTLATLGAARIMGMDDALGSVTPGKLADLILVDGDPTRDISDIRRVVLVVKDGRIHDPAAIYRALGIRPCCDE